ncbi:nucleotidyltransferase domain-containing protein [Sphingomonas sp. MG17]|uniref:Nucleotidyltransferase domain-containing protein n=1 Tax=Sphingomonas tagetis TaxID=2949092 RepID=A0A9X2KQV7_9SPHN|nr:GSU2403 family nucleotidyltransferase fold protein [Sphingomonas tagetis]MCP3732193.1 nucleotidyltransferase domain-containing protein [Sphingomonas tagetis]
MASVVKPFSEEQARALVNLRQRYEVWMEAERTLAGLPYDLRRKEVGGRSYLYEIKDRSGNGKSLGAWSDEHAVRLEAYRAQKSDAKTRRDGSRTPLEETGRLGRALQLPMVANEAGPILREADRRGLLDGALLVVGTNAVPAYSIEAGGLIRELPDETADFDLAWAETEASDGEQVLWQMLKAVDRTFTVNTERTFQARNAKAYEVEILVAPSRVATMSRTDRPKPVPLPEQEWLLEGCPVDHVVICRDGSPARIVAPDPRWFALQKLWMADQPKRNALKRGKDAKQGMLLLNAVAEAMPLYPLNDDFERSLPGELAPYFVRWAEQRQSRTPSAW